MHKTLFPLSFTVFDAFSIHLSPRYLFSNWYIGRKSHDSDSYGEKQACNRFSIEKQNGATQEKMQMYKEYLIQNRSQQHIHKTFFFDVSSSSNTALSFHFAKAHCTLKMFIKRT